jgi:hypothetical protein
MNKILIRSFLLFIITGLLLLIILRSRSPFGKTNSSFASEPKHEITKIEFSESGKRLTLEKKSESWMINGKTETRKNGVYYILRILKEIKIKSPVSQELFESEITRKNVSPVKVRVYEHRKLLKTFLVYKTGSNIYGNIMKIKESSKPFIVYVPGYEGDIGSGFTINELFWQPYTVFNLLPSEIASVNFENLSDTASSFSIINRDHHYSLSGAAGNLRGWDPSLIERYISYFAWVPFESWAFEIGIAEKKSIEAQQPLYRITVISTTGRKNVLSLWGMQSGKSGATAIDSDRLLGKTEAADELFILRYFDIDPLIKKRSYFFPQ